MAENLGTEKAYCAVRFCPLGNCLERNRYRRTIGPLRPLPGTGHLAGVLRRAHRALLYRSGSSAQANSPEPT